MGGAATGVSCRVDGLGTLWKWPQALRSKWSVPRRAAGRLLEPPGAPLTRYVRRQSRPMAPKLLRLAADQRLVQTQRAAVSIQAYRVLLMVLHQCDDTG